VAERVAVSDPWRAHVEALGEFIRSQRQLAKLSLRDVAQRARVSNPYLSQVERGKHEPSVRVLAAIAAALDISTETLLARAGLLDDADAEVVPTASTTAAIRADDALTTEQKEALLAVYRSYIEANRP
jgi:transcriptional regulator with XRE-family HTH domain